MKKRGPVHASIAAVILALVLGLGLVAAAIQADYDLTWWTVDTGGGMVEGGGYKLNSTIGQHDAAQAVSGGDYSLTGGFWPAGEKVEDDGHDVFLPLVVRAQ